MLILLLQYYYHEDFESFLRIQSMGLLKVQIMKYLQIVREHIKIHFLTVFKISKTNNA